MRKFLAILRLVIFLVLIGLAIFFIYKLVINARNKSDSNKTVVTTSSEQKGVNGSTSISSTSDSSTGSDIDSSDKSTDSNSSSSPSESSTSDVDTKQTESEASVPTSQNSGSSSSASPSTSTSTTNTSTTPETGSGLVGTVIATVVSALTYLVVLKKQKNRG